MATEHPHPIVNDFGALKETPPQTQEPINVEAVLTGVVALATLFSNCVEAFNLVHPGHRWDKHEQILIASLGLQQARLLIWGDVVGVSSPPVTVTDRAIPKHPSAAYPDLKEPTFFGARDPRLDNEELRKQIEDALSSIVDRSTNTSREDMMAKYGLKPPKRFGADFQPALDINRLESFRERHELLKEVAETYAQINTRRTSSITSTSWQIVEFHKFGGFIKHVTEKIDYLIKLMDVQERVDRGMCMDIRALGWHLSADRQRVAMDTSKLKLIQDVAKDDYPQYLAACQQALDNIDRERRENAADYNPYAAMQYAPVGIPSVKQVSGKPVAIAPSRDARGSISVQHAEHLSPDANGAGKEKKGGLFGGLFGRRKSHSHIETDKQRSQSVNDARPMDPERSKSDTGMFPSSGEHPVSPGAPSAETPTSPTQEVISPPPQTVDQEAAPLEAFPGAVRSKSVGDILHAPINTDEHEETRNMLEKLKTADLEGGADTGTSPADLTSSISAHDQYHGLARQGTHTQYD